MLGCPVWSDPSKRFWSKVDKGGPVPIARPDLGPCWIWKGNRTKTGYGMFCPEKGRTIMAHRFAFGPVPEGLELDHLCRVRSCVNPAHLEAVTHAENVRRGRSGMAERTHCPKGHEYTPENTYVWKKRKRADGTRGVGRHCRTCYAAHNAKPERKAALRRLYGRKKRCGT